MMKKTIIMALVVLGAVSCAKEQVQVPKEMASFTIEAAIEDNATKTQISDADDSFTMEWSVGDSFKLYDGTSLITCNRKNKKNTKFTSEQTPVGNSFYAYYPASAVASAADGAFEVTLPSTIEYTAGNITLGQFPMSGHGSKEGMGFRNLCALVSVKLEADAADKTRQLKNVTLSAGKPVCGKAKVAFGSDQLTIDEDGGTDITINCNGVSLADAPVMHFTVPVGTYGSFVIRIETMDAGYAMIQLNGPFELKRSMDYSATLQTGPFCSPYVSTVLDVDLAPGQFINTLPAGLGTKESAIEAIANVIVGSTSNYIHLGGWGGSVTVGFDHPILNLEGADFRGYGNGFAGSSEPGVYYVAQKDAQGKPAKWYLIRHSMYDYSIHDYTITYYKPEIEVGKQCFLAWDGTYASDITSVGYTDFSKITEIESKDPDCTVWYLYKNNIYKDAGASTDTKKNFHKANCVSGAASDKNKIPNTYQGYPVVYSYSTTMKAFENYIYWEDNRGHNGYECKNSYHAQSYWPEYAGESITITGEYLPVNSFDTSGSGNKYVQDAKWWGFPLDDKGFGIGAYGFCDNYPNADPLSTIDISWAVDENGNSVKLDYIDFIKVQSGVHKQSGWIGEISTEFQGIEDLHLLGEKVYPDTTVTPDINNIPQSGDPLQPETGLLYWSYTPVVKS